LLGTERKTRIQWKLLLENVNQEEVFQSVLGYYPNLHQKFKSPFRSDKNPGCRFEWKNGYLCLIENTRYKGRLYWNIIHTIMELKNLNFSETLEYIAKGRFEGVNIPIQKTSLHIRFTTQEWTKDNLFFLDPNILKRENIFLVKDYWWGRSGNWKKNKWGTELCIAYYFPETEHTKLYFPNNPPEQKWFANINSNDIFGLDSLNQEGDLLIITKSQKDRVTLKYHYGYENVIALQNEGCYIPINIVNDLKNRFKRIIIIFDNDPTGYDNAQHLSNLYNIEYKIIESEYKDSYENFINNYKIII